MPHVPSTTLKSNMVLHVRNNLLIFVEVVRFAKGLKV